MYNKQAKNIYQQNQILTASPKKLVTLLYEGSLKNLRIAELSLEKGDYQKVNESLIKHQDILGELQRTLNLEEGGEIAQDLDALYSFLTNEALQANVQKDVTKIKNSQKLIEELRDTWNQI
ncbi:flagellar export chaperone FliS [Jeotgalibaca ciconiae]|uniref:Flagellar export chaperone FliS n=1 Tax=Jeotgalibaca ciconiae TaxID=2496265 RepID=A0A3Q9BK83_9LACT|nr:flagellar export chaperone FliS [Jeotgalibaca ciconiae]AZP04269.1 flagellar export chaperone FliS [Jeotgalibaca ciconiae]